MIHECNISKICLKYIDTNDAYFGRVRGVRLLGCVLVVIVILRQKICMWFGPVNKETYVHGCDRARSLSIGNKSGDRDDPTGLELSPVGRSSLFLNWGRVCVCHSIASSKKLDPFLGVGLFYSIKRPTRTW